MLFEYMHLTNNYSKIFNKISSQLGVKSILNVCLTLFWAVILIGTFKHFI
jgi:hypothetical protein